MLILRWKRWSPATRTISGGADVVKPTTSHDIQYEGTGNNDNSDFAGKGRGHTVEWRTVQRQTIAKQNKHNK